jgi:hypothetical protein
MIGLLITGAVLYAVNDAIARRVDRQARKTIRAVTNVVNSLPTQDSVREMFDEMGVPRGTCVWTDGKSYYQDEGHWSFEPDCDQQIRRNLMETGKP